MKKIFFLGLIFSVLAVSASAQSKEGDHPRHHKEMRSYHRGEITHFEKKRLHHDEFRYRIARRKAHRDGFVNQRERRRLAMMRKHHRHEFRHFAHNDRRRVI